MKTTKLFTMINYYDLIINNPTYFKQFSCKDLLFLNYDCPVTIRKAAKWSEHNYIYYVLSGKKTIHTIDHSVTLTSGSIAFIKKGACIVEQHFEEPFCIVVFMMPDSFMRDLLSSWTPSVAKIPDPTPPVISVFDDQLTKGFYQSILPYFASIDDLPADIIELKFKELMYCLLNNPANDQLRAYFYQAKNLGETSIRKIMESNYGYNLSLRDYARLTNRSISSFKRDFQSVYHMTPGKWLIEQKLIRAKKLLLETNDAIASIAFDSGFENAAHFTRLFRQKNGITPMAYRRQVLESFSVAI